MSHLCCAYFSDASATLKHLVDEHSVCNYIGNVSHDRVGH